MNTLRTFLLVLSLISSTAMAQIEGWPTVDEVLDRFYNSYEVPLTNAIVLLGRTPDGWYAYGMEDEGLSLVQWKELFWEAKQGTYRELKRPLPKRASYQSPKNKSRAERQHNRSSFERFPFFGYIGWEKDVIKWYEGERQKRELKDEELETLGRTYSIYATQILRNQYGFRKPYQPSFGYQQVPQMLRASYLLYAKNALEAFGELKQRNPDYMTFIGDIGTKYANEHMANYLNLLTIKEPEKAREFARVEGLYPKRILSYAQNALEGCARNAVLITYGDNDTYPLWYVQESMGFRKDVSVINYSLLGMSAYVEMCRERHGINFQIRDSAYQKLSYVVFDKEDPSRNPPSLDKLIMEIDQLKNPPRSLLSTKSFTHTPNKTHIRAQFPSLQTEESLTKWEGLLGMEYLRRNEIALWDLFASNDWKRPLYFAGTFDAKKLGIFEDLLWKEGLHYRLIPVANVPNQIFGAAGHSLPLSQAYFLQEFEGEELNLSLIHGQELFPQKDDLRVFPPEKGIYGNFVSFYLQLLQETFSQEDEETFGLLEDKFRKLMAMEEHRAQNQFVFYFLNYFRLVADMNFRLGRKEEGMIYTVYILRSLEAYPETEIRFPSAFTDLLLDEIEALGQSYELGLDERISKIREALKVIED